MEEEMPRIKYLFQTSPLPYLNAKAQKEVEEFILKNNIYKPSIEKTDSGSSAHPVGNIYWLEFLARERTPDDIFREQVEYMIENL